MFDHRLSQPIPTAFARLFAFGERVFPGFQILLLGISAQSKRAELLDKSGEVRLWDGAEEGLGEIEQKVIGSDQVPERWRLLSNAAGLSIIRGVGIGQSSGGMSGWLLLARAEGESVRGVDEALLVHFADQVAAFWKGSDAQSQPSESSLELDFPLLVERLLEILCEVDSRGQIRSINSSAERLLGFAEGELPGRNLVDLVHPDDRFRVRDALAEGELTGGFETEVRVQRRGGYYCYFDCRGVAVTTGETAGFFVVGRDISRRKRAEAEVRRLESWFQLVWKNSRDAMRLIDGDGLIVEVNQAYCQLVGKRREELLGRLYIVAYRYEDSDVVLEDYRRRFLTRSVASHEDVEVTLWNGEERVFERTGSFFDVEGKCLLLTIYRDITERRRKEAELKELNQALKQRAAHLGALTLQLTRVEQEERRRLAQAVHDHLQQLLVAARMTMERVRRRIPEGDLAETAGEVEDLLSESIEASRSITVELSPPILHEAGLVAGLEWLQRRMEQKHSFRVRLDVDMAAEPKSEPLRLFLFQAVRELVFNCFKHSGVEEVEVSLQPETPRRVRLVVEDRGAGFDSQRVRSNEGSKDCFGLFSLRERLENLGGRMEISSSLGGGARITLSAPSEPEISLPASGTNGFIRRGRRGADDTGREETDLAKRKIRLLLVDDHKILRQGLRELLHEQPDILVVGEAENGLEGIQLAQELKPDVVVMDLAMPVMNGIEATRVLTAELPQIKVIGLSMHMKEDMANAMLEAGACTYVTKATASETLSETIRECLEAINRPG